MNPSLGVAVGLTLSMGLALAAATAQAQPFGMGHGMMHGMGHGAGGHGPMAGPVAMLTRQDDQSVADMGLVHDLLMNHAAIKRTVTKLPNGIKTVTESDDPRVAQTIQAHVARMSQRLKDGREFNIFSTTLPVLFDNREKIESVVEMTATGAVVTRTSTDAKVVAALQGHAAEVTELANEGMVAMRRGMMARMAMGPGGPRAGAAPTPSPAPQSAVTSEHAH